MMRFRSLFAAWPAARWCLLLIFGLGIALRIAAFSFWNFHHPDGLLQYLEQAHRLATGRGLDLWEYRIGIRNWLIPLLLTPGMALGEALDPGGLTGAWLARGTQCTLGIIAIGAAWRLGRAASVAAGLIAALVVAAWYESVLFGVELLSESVAAPLMLLGTAWLLVPRKGSRDTTYAGAALALGAVIRFQWAGFAGVLAIAALRGNWRRWRALLIGAAPVLVLGGMIDAAFGQVPYQWVVRNFAQNIGAGQAARFGISPAWEYLRLLYVNFGVCLPIVLGVSLFAGWRLAPAALAALANLALHSLIGHKEFRFIWISVLVLLVLAAIGSARAGARIAADRGWDGRAMLLAIAAGWLGLSALAYRQTGGEGAFRGGGQTSLALYDAAHRPGICGITVAHALMWAAAPVLEGGNAPIYVAPDTRPDGRLAPPLPPALVAAGNGYIGEAAPSPLARSPWHRAGCHANNGYAACLYVRPGGCDVRAGAAYTEQAVLRREGY